MGCAGYDNAIDIGVVDSFLPDHNRTKRVPDSDHPSKLNTGDGSVAQPLHDLMGHESHGLDRQLIAGWAGTAA
jgi:hypothetical protein